MMKDPRSAKEQRALAGVSPLQKCLGLLGFLVPYVGIQFLMVAIPVSCVRYPWSVIFVLTYYIYTLGIGRYELDDGKHSPDFSSQNILCQWMRTFLQMQALPMPKELREAEAKPNAQFLFAQFPHAIWADYHVPMEGLWKDEFPHIHKDIRTLVATVLFRVPIVREWSLWTGGIDASRKVAEKALSRGRSIMVRPGGEAEQLRTTRGKEIVYLKNRRGFLRLAMSKGIPVVPCYVFGASDYHYTWGGIFSPREFIQKRFGVCLPIAMGYFGTLCPLPVKTTVVFGVPMTFTVKEKGNPSHEELLNAHKTFCDELTKLFDTHKRELGYGERELEIIL
jgi:1-acyl-sn-glycerol-3-phosphate acyltransferase